MDKQEIQFLKVLLRGNWNPQRAQDNIPAPAPVFLPVKGVPALNEGGDGPQPVFLSQGKAVTVPNEGDGPPEPPPPVFLGGAK